MPIDFTKPVITGNYATDILQPIVQAQTALAQMLDPAVAGTLTGTPTGAYRINTNALERWSGAAWVAYALNIGGNSATATALQTARLINGVSFNGTADISVNAVNALTFNNGGAGAASGTTYNGGAAVTVSYNTVGAPSATGTGATGTWGISITGNAATATSATTAGSATTATTAGTATNVSGTGNVASGTYTPTVNAGTAVVCRFMRIGNNVIVNGAVVGISLSSSGGSVLVSLPIARSGNFISTTDATGTIGATPIPGQWVSGNVQAATGTQNITVQYATNTTVSSALLFTFQYSLT